MPSRSRIVLGAFFVAAGVLHFVKPRPYESIMPEALPAHRELVYVSGLAEIAGGAGVLSPRTSRLAGWWLIATMLAVFPANINMAINDIPMNGEHVAPLMRWGRLPLQLVLIAWAFWYTRRDRSR
jgi:uncharacterized membrane protein